MNTVDALATYRLTRLILVDEFPPVEWMKERVEEAVPESAKEYSDKLLECPWCISFWIAIIVLTLRKTVPGVWDPLGKALAMSAVAGIMSGRFD